MNDILDIVYSYSKKFRLLDDNSIRKILDILIDINDLSSLEYTIVDKNNLFLAKRELGYYENDEIVLFSSNLRNRVKNEKHIIFDDEIKLPLFQKVLRQNLEILHTIFHEIEHAIQYENMKDFNDNTIEKKLLRYEYCFVKNAIGHVVFYDAIDKLERYISGTINYYKDKKIYNDNYNLSIMERFADYYSLDKIQQLLLPIEKEICKLYELEHFIKLHFLMKPYIEMDQLYTNDDKIYSPTIQFLENLRYYDTFDNASIEQLSYEDRFKYGFYLTQEEFDNNLNKLEKKNI